MGKSSNHETGTKYRVETSGHTESDTQGGRMSTESTPAELDCRNPLAPGQRRMLFAIVHFLQGPDGASLEAWQSYMEFACVIVPDDLEHATDSKTL